MSAMAYREPNEVLWRGCRPGHKGTQVAASGVATNTTTIVWTVTAGKTGFLVAWGHDVDFSGAAGVCTLGVRNAADTIQYILSTYVGRAVASVGKAVGLKYPIEIPAGYDVYVTSNDAAATSRGFVHGWEE